MSDKDPIFHDDPANDPVPHPDDDLDPGVVGSVERAFESVMAPLAKSKLTPEEREESDRGARGE